MENMFNSTAMYRNKLIDCRCLTVAFEYFDFSDKEVLQLLEDTIHAQTGRLGASWTSKITINGKGISAKASFSIAKNIFKQHGWVSFEQEAFKTSPIVNNTQTLRQYLSKVRVISAPLATSSDFPDYWHKLFSDDIDSPAIQKNKIVQLFNEKNKHSVNYFSYPDIQLLFVAIPYEKQKNRFYGRFYVQMSAFLLDNQVNMISNLLATFAVDISCKYQNVNARVQLQPVGVGARSPHMRYFGSHAQCDGSHLDLPVTQKEWYQTYYIPGSEWLNIVSPLAQVHLKYTRKDETANFTAKKLNGGGMLIQSCKDITDYDIDDARMIKEFLYPALYPGACILPLKELFRADDEKFMYTIFPRREWEILPLATDELDIIGTDLVFSYKR